MAAPRDIPVKILVAVDADGAWAAAGSSTESEADRIEQLLEWASCGNEARPLHFVYVEARVPLPADTATVKGATVAAETLPASAATAGRLP